MFFCQESSPRSQSQFALTISFTIPAFMLVAVMVISRSIGLEKHAAIKQGALFVLAVSLITATQFVPYFFLKNGPSVLLSGLQALLHFPEGSSFIDIVESQFLTKDTLGFYIFMCISAGAMVFILIAHSKERRSDLTASIMLLGTLLSLASIMGIEYSAIKTHYHWHYSIMYVPYATVFFTYLCVIVCERRATWPTMVKYSLFLIGLSVWYFSVVGVQLLNLAQTTFKPELSLLINHRNIDSGLRDFLTKVISRGMTFYVPENFNYHRLLNQTQIGDGHRAMLREVLSGGRVGPVASIFLYSDDVYKAPCLSLWESQKDLIIVGPGRNLRPSGTPSGSTNGLVLRCLLQAASGYEEIPSDHTNYRIFCPSASIGSAWRTVIVILVTETQSAIEIRRPRNRRAAAQMVIIIVAPSSDHRPRGRRTADAAPHDAQRIAIRAVAAALQGYDHHTAQAIKVGSFRPPQPVTIRTVAKLSESETPVAPEKPARLVNVNGTGFVISTRLAATS